MSQNDQQAGAALPDPQTAYSNLFMGVHQRVFFDKLASAGIAPQSEQQAVWMLETAGKLRQVEQLQPKQAADDPFYRMNAALDRVLAGHGVTPPAAHAYEQSVKQAAADLAADPTFYNSVLALKAAEAEQLLAQGRAA